MTHTLTLVLAAAGCLACLACVDTSPDRVKLTATVGAVDLSVTKGPLVTSLSGTLSFGLSVGDLASGDDVMAAAPTFQLTSAGEQAGPGIDALPASGTFPLTLASGETRAVVFSLTDQNTLDAAELSSLCAGPVRVVASFRDSLSGDRATSVQSEPVTVKGCSP